MQSCHVVMAYIVQSLQIQAKEMWPTFMVHIVIASISTAQIDTACATIADLIIVYELLADALMGLHVVMAYIATAR